MNDFAHVDFWEMIIRATAAFVIILSVTRFLGKKQLSHLTFFNYVTGITIGSIAADIAGETETPFFNGVVSIVWWSVLTILVGFIALKSTKVRILLDGEPTILIKRGKIMKQALYSSRLNLDDLSMMLRENNVFSTKDVNYAILEPDGRLSVLMKEAQQQVTKADMNIAPRKFVYLPSEIIADGKIVYKNLKELNLTEVWVHNELKKHGIRSVEEVLYAEIQQDGSLFIDKC
ncbi:DUF421 domain-containing protein [Paenibacillus assamensis]|uniref:DUF421 domain-containing protein n=1 Tax=Paenibacillus assamensis TaxID=311244 RepID=UPI00040DF6C3|nr:DUF421 domain-containing protein [Paenibacillus assamensis]